MNTRLTLASLLAALSIGSAQAEDTVTICTATQTPICRTILKGSQGYVVFQPLTAEEQAKLSPPISVGPPKSQARVPADPAGKERARQ